MVIIDLKMKDAKGVSIKKNILEWAFDLKV